MRTNKDELKQTLEEFERVIHSTQARLREFLLGKSTEEMREILKDLTAEDLELLGRLAVPHEDYEICSVVQKLINERKKIV